MCTYVVAVAWIVYDDLYGMLALRHLIIPEEIVPSRTERRWQRSSFLFFTVNIARYFKHIFGRHATVLPGRTAQHKSRPFKFKDKLVGHVAAQVNPLNRIKVFKTFFVPHGLRRLQGDG